MEGRPALILSLVAAMAIAAGGLYFIVEQGVPILDSKGDTSASTPSPPVPAPPDAPPVTAPSTGAATRPGSTIYRCQKGRSVTYSDSPCEGGKVVDVQHTRGYDTSRAAAANPKAAAMSEPAAPAVASTVDQPPAPAECKRLEELIAWIDSEARQSGNTERAEELKERRLKAVHRRNELHC